MIRHAGYRIEKVIEGISEVTYVFEKGNIINVMVFYFSIKGGCFAYSVVYDQKYGNELSNYIKDKYKYNADEDYYENTRCKLYYKGGSLKHEIFVTDIKTENQVSISMK